MEPNDVLEAIVGLPRPLLLAFDVDGTLAPIVTDPDEARVPADVRAALRALVRTRGVKVALVTGRAAQSLSRVVSVRGAWRALEHGRVIVGPGERLKRQIPMAPETALLAEFAAWAHAEAVPRGARLEVKPMSRSVHVRGLPSDIADAVLADAQQCIERLGLHVRLGRAVLEAEVRWGDKGQALTAIAKRNRSRGLLYAGDDRTDEPALAVAAKRGGVGVFVTSTERPRPPEAATATLYQPELRKLVCALPSVLGKR